MSRRRIMAPLAAAGIALAFAAPGALVGAQEAPTVTIFVNACDVVGTGSSGVVKDDVAPPDSFTNCAAVDLNAGDWGLTVDGLAPSSFSGNEAVWVGRGDGPHTADTGMGSTGSTLEFTIAGEDVTLYAFYGRAVSPTETPAATETVEPTADVTGTATVPATATETTVPAETAVATATTTVAAAADQLPNTGTGSGSETGFGIALAAMAASAVAGTAGLAIRRRR
ncbi:MAG: hypothetical protein WBA46_12855 [Thermomicrobiales bacterium]